MKNENIHVIGEDGHLDQPHVLYLGQPIFIVWKSTSESDDSSRQIMKIFIITVDP